MNVRLTDQELSSLVATNHRTPPGPVPHGHHRYTVVVGMGRNYEVYARDAKHAKALAGEYALRIEGRLRRPGVKNVVARSDA